VLVIRTLPDVVAPRITGPGALRSPSCCSLNAAIPLPTTIVPTFAVAEFALMVPPLTVKLFVTITPTPPPPAPLNVATPVVVVFVLKLAVPTAVKVPPTVAAPRTLSWPPTLVFVIVERPFVKLA
jgi:hypothetical protein